MSLFELSILIISVLWISTVFFWAVVRPYILESAAWELSKLRAEMDWAIIEEKEGAQSRAAQHLSSTLNGPDLTRVISLSHLVFCDILWKPNNQVAAIEQARIFENAPRWLMEAFQRCVRVRVKTILANSIVWWIPIALILLCGYFSTAVANWWDSVCLAMLMKPRCFV